LPNKFIYHDRKI